VAGRQLRGQLDGRLREDVEQLEAQVGRERVTEPLGDLRRALVSQLGESLQVLLEPFEDDRQIYCDITMTSLLTLVKCHDDERSASQCPSDAAASAVANPGRWKYAANTGSSRRRGDES